MHYLYCAHAHQDTGGLRAEEQHAITAVKTDKGLISGSTGLNRAESLVFRRCYAPYAARWRAAMERTAARRCPEAGVAMPDLSDLMHLG